MDLLRKDFTSSTSPKPKFAIHGNDENEVSEELASKLEISDKKRSPVTDFKDTVRSKKMSAKRNKTLDLQEQPGLSKSFSFDSSVSRLCAIDGEDREVGKNSLVVGSNLQPYDPIKNYLSPRPKYLRYSPDRHREIVARQENVNRFIKSASFDCGMPFSDDNEEVESSVECSVEDSGEIIDESVGHSENEDTHEEEYHDNNNGVEEELFDDIVVDKGWSLNVFWQYLFAMIALILITSSIVFMNSPTHLPARDAIRDELGGESFDSMMLMVGNSSNSEIERIYDEWDKKVAVVNTGELIEMQHDRIKDVCGDEFEELDYTESNDHDETDKVTEVEVEETEGEEESSYQLKDPVSITSKEIETREINPEKETYSHLNDKPEVVRVNNNGADENKIEGIKTYGYLIKLASFDPKFAAFFGISVVTLSVLCCLMMKILKNKVFRESFGPKRSLFAESQECNFSQSYGKNYVSLTHSNASSSGQTNYEMSTGDSPSTGSFTVEKKIIKKQKSKTPEVMISTVRRSSRIHKRSFMSSPSSLNYSY